MKKNILIVDDTPDLLDVLEQALIFAGFDVTRAKDGKEAWELFQTRPLDIILSDYLMPNMDGRQLFDLVRQSKKGMNTPFIFMSSKSDLLQAAGIYEVLQKPFHFEALISKLSSLPEEDQKNYAGI